MNIPFLVITLLVISFGTSTAGEPTHSLLTELIQPHLATGNKTSAPSRPALPELTDGHTAMYTLEELKDGIAPVSEIQLPDDEQAADLPLALNDKVEYFINFFQTRGRLTYSRWLARSTRYMPMMREILRKEGLPDELVYVAMIESGFQLHARSWASAVGPWQFISTTGRRYALRIDRWVDERKDPVKATMAAAMYLKELYGMFNNDWYLATAGYNAGENKIFRAINMYETNDFWELSKGSYLKRETKEYVPKLLAAAIIAKDPARYGFTEITSVPVVEYDTVTIKNRIDLDLVAKLTGTTRQTIKELNPALLHWCTPPNYPDYELNIPKGTRELFELQLAAIPSDQHFNEKTLYRPYTAARKDSLKVLARKFGIPAAKLAEINGLEPSEKIAGRKLLVPVKHIFNFAEEGRNRTAAGSKNQYRYYTVRKGDTLQKLAKRFNVSTRLLVVWNQLKQTVALKPGKRLIVAKNKSISEGKG